MNIYTVKVGPMNGETKRYLVKATDGYEALKKVLDQRGQNYDDLVIDLKFLHIEKWCDPVEMIGDE